MKALAAQTLRDLREGRYVEHYVAIIVAVGVAALSVLGDVRPTVTASATLATLAVLLYGHIKSDRTFRRLQDAVPSSAVTQFYTERAEREPLEQRLRTSRSEILIQGLQLGAVTHGQLPLLRGYAEQGIRIKLLLMSPFDENGAELPWVDEVGRVHTFKGLSNLLHGTIEHLRDWFDAMPAKVQGRVEIRFYATIPTVSVLAVDKDSPYGWMQVEPLMYEFPPSVRPSFTLKKGDAPKLYDRTLKSLNDLWTGSTPLQRLPVFKSEGGANLSAQKLV